MIKDEDYKKLKPGDVIYIVTRLGLEYTYLPKRILFAIIDKVYTDGVWVNFYTKPINKRVNGVLISDFDNNEQKRKKLPKGWSYDTRLYEYTFDEYPEEMETFLKNTSISDKERIKEAIERGYLVQESYDHYAYIEEDITKEGYVLVKKTPFDCPLADHHSFKINEIYLTYEDALQHQKDEEAEFKRQSEMSYLDWSKYSIEKELDIWKAICKVDDNTVQRIKDYIFSMDKVEDIEVRCLGNKVEWKYWNKKRWARIPYDDWRY